MQVINGKAVYGSGETLPAVGTPEYNLASSAPADLASFKAANPGLSFTSEDQAQYNAAAPVSALSSSNGSSTIDSHITAHNADMAAINTAGSATSMQTTPAAGVGTALTAQEANAAGVDLTKYSYDPNTKLYSPSNSSTLADTASGTQYAADQKTINDAFASQVAGMDSATAALMQSIQGIYSGRIADQQEANRRELAGFNTGNIRFGTDRYAPETAGGILTADERVGLDRVNKIAQEEAGLMAQAQQSLTDKKYAAFVDQRNQLQTLRTERLNTLKDLQTRANQVADAKTAQAQKDKDTVQTIATDAAKAGATPATIAAITSSATPAAALSAAGDSIQSSTNPDVAGYLFYKSQANSNGVAPEDFDTWKKAQDQEAANKAYGTAFATAKGKAAGESAAAGPSGPSLPVTSSQGITYNVPASVAPYTHISPNGVKYIDASALTPTERAQVMKDAYNGGVNPISVITNPNQALDVSNIADATLKLADIKKVFDGLTTDSAAARDTYYAAAITMAKKLQTDPNAAAADVYEDAALDILKAMSGTQGFRGGASMVDMVKSTFPQKTDTTATVDQKIANMQSLINDRETGLLGKPSASDQLIIDAANAQGNITNFVSSTPSITVNGQATSTAAVVSNMLRIPGATPASVYQALEVRGLIPAK